MLMIHQTNRQPPPMWSVLTYLYVVWLKSHLSFCSLVPNMGYSM